MSISYLKTTIVTVLNAPTDAGYKLVLSNKKIFKNHLQIQTLGDILLFYLLLIEITILTIVVILKIGISETNIRKTWRYKLSIFINELDTLSQLLNTNNLQYSVIMYRKKTFFNTTWLKISACFLKRKYYFLF